MHFLENFIDQSRSHDDYSTNNINISHNLKIDCRNLTTVNKASPNNNISISYNHVYQIFFGIIGFSLLSFSSYKIFKYLRRRFNSNNNQFEHYGNIFDQFSSQINFENMIRRYNLLNQHRQIDIDIDIINPSENPSPAISPVNQFGDQSPNLIPLNPILRLSYHDPFERNPSH